MTAPGCGAEEAGGGSGQGHVDGSPVADRAALVEGMVSAALLGLDEPAV